MSKKLPQRNKTGNILLNIYAYLTKWVPENNLKKSLRLFSLKHKFFVFDELSVNYGENYVLIGTPQPKKIHRLSKLVGPRGNVVLVEPAPPNIAKHLKMIEEKKLDNVTLIPKAISDYQGSAKFLLALSDSSNRLVFDDVLVDNDFAEENVYKDKIDVEVDTVDNVINQIGIEKIHFIEIATNGAEMAALRGMKKSLKVTERAYVKGHCINKETGEPLHVEQSNYLRKFGFNVKITKPSPSSAKTTEWGMRQGDVFAYR